MLFDPAARQPLFLHPRTPQSAQLMRNMTPQQFAMQIPQGYQPRTNQSQNVGRSFQHHSQQNYNSYPAQPFGNINHQPMMNSLNHQSTASGSQLYMMNTNVPRENSNRGASAFTGLPLMEFHGQNTGRMEGHSMQVTNSIKVKVFFLLWLR